MTKKKDPPPEKIPLVPSLFPDEDLPSRYFEKFKSLREEGYNEYQAVKLISNEYGISQSGLRLVLFPTAKIADKKRSAEYWIKKKEDKEFRKQVNKRKKQYMAVRRNLSEYVRESFERVGYEPQELSRLSYLLKEVSGVMIKPNSLKLLNAQYEQKHGTPILEEIVSSAGPTKMYVLHKPYG